MLKLSWPLISTTVPYTTLFRSINDDRLRHSPCIIAEIPSEILVFASDDITEHFIRPAHFPCDSFCVRIEKKFRTVEPQPAFWVVRTGNAKTIELPWPHIRQKNVPYLVVCSVTGMRMFS